MEYFFAFFVALGLNIILFFPAFAFKTDKLTDISYALSFVIVSAILLGMSSLSATHVVLFVMIFLWAFRLGTYLLVRIRRIKKDKRFDGMRENFFRFLRFWVLQGFTVFVVLLGAVSYFSTENVSLNLLSVLGILVYATGLIIEAIADMQKYRFINNPQNKGLWIDSGLWHYSRHPNYFGEILVWVGVWIFVLSGVSFFGGLIGFLSPLFITVLLLFVYGVPLLEKQADKRWGSNGKYQQYKKTTSKLILLPKKRL